MNRLAVTAIATAASLRRRAVALPVLCAAWQGLGGEGHDNDIPSGEGPG